MKIIIPKQVHDKVMHWVNKTSNEVSGFGKVIFDSENKTFTVTDAFLVEQTGGSAHTDIDGGSLGKLMYKTKDTEGELKWWWHSHVKMSVFWSSTDTDTIKELGGNGWITASVFNQKNEVRSAVCWKTTSELGSSLSINDNIDTEILTNVDPALVELWDAEFTENVKPEPVRVYSGNSQYSQFGYGAGYQYTEHDELDPRWRNQGMATRGFHKADENQSASEKNEASATSKNVGDITDHEQETFDHGLLGYGAVIEAQALNMSTTSYLNSILYGTDKDQDLLIAKLLQLESRGWV